MLQCVNKGSCDAPQVFSEEREELHATLDCQDVSIRRASLERQRLSNETARLKQALQAKDHVIRLVEFDLKKVFSSLCSTATVHKRAPLYYTNALTN